MRGRHEYGPRTKKRLPKYQLRSVCPGGKYCCSILYLLANHGRSIRFNELKHSIGDVPCKTLSSTLKKMESEGLLQRTEYPQIPPRVEYSLTELGQSLKPVLDAMWAWGEGYKAKTC